MSNQPTSKADWASRLLPSLFSYQHPDSIVNRMRARRMNKLRAHFFPYGESAQPVRILDIGGTVSFWKSIGGLPAETHRIMLLNLHLERLDPAMPNIESMTGNALALPFEDQSFDIVFSNSVIEHVGSPDNQHQMAREVMRVGKKHVTQTPSLWFPLEPHARLPFFQFLPRWLRAFLIFNFTINYFPKGKTYRDCLAVSDSTILLTRRNMCALFPGAIIVTERLWGLPKSYIAIGGDVDAL